MNTNIVTVFLGSIASAFFRASLGRNHLSSAAMKAASARHSADSYKQVKSVIQFL